MQRYLIAFLFVWSAAASREERQQKVISAHHDGHFIQHQEHADAANVEENPRPRGLRRSGSTIHEVRQVDNANKKASLQRATAQDVAKTNTETDNSNADVHDEQADIDNAIQGGQDVMGADVAPKLTRSNGFMCDPVKYAKASACQTNCGYGWNNAERRATCWPPKVLPTGKTCTCADVEVEAGPPKKTKYMCSGDGCECLGPVSRPHNKICVAANKFLCYWKMINDDFSQFSNGYSWTSTFINASDGNVKVQDDGMMDQGLADALGSVVTPVVWVGSSGGYLQTIATLTDMACHGEEKCKGTITMISTVMTIVGLALLISGVASVASSIPMAIVSLLMSSYGERVCKMGLRKFAKWVYANSKEVVTTAMIPCRGDEATVGGCLGHLAYGFVMELKKLVVAIMRHFIISVLKIVVGVPRMIYKMLTDKSRLTDQDTTCCALKSAMQAQDIDDNAQHGVGGVDDDGNNIPCDGDDGTSSTAKCNEVADPLPDHAGSLLEMSEAQKEDLMLKEEILRQTNTPGNAHSYDFGEESESEPF